MTRGGRVLVLSLLGIGVAWFFFRRSGVDSTMTGGVKYNELDLNAVTRTLLAETSFNRPETEQVGIVQVMVNRSRQNGVSLSEVAVPPGIPNWNNSDRFRERWEESVDYPQFDRARDFVKTVLDGGYQNPIGDRVQFLHPRGMPKCDGKSCPRGRECVDTVAGPRCLPLWSVGSNVITIDGARFS